MALLIVWMAVSLSCARSEGATAIACEHVAWLAAISSRALNSAGSFTASAHKCCIPARPREHAGGVDDGAGVVKCSKKYVTSVWICGCHRETGYTGKGSSCSPTEFFLLEPSFQGCSVGDDGLETLSSDDIERDRGSCLVTGVFDEAASSTEARLVLLRVGVPCLRAIVSRRAWALARAAWTRTARRVSSLSVELLPAKTETNATPCGATHRSFGDVAAEAFEDTDDLRDVEGLGDAIGEPDIGVLQP